jgi:hypothetical protein
VIPTEILWDPAENTRCRYAGAQPTIRVYKHTGGALHQGRSQSTIAMATLSEARTASGGPFIINPDQVPTILKHGYAAVAEKDVEPGDIAVFWEGTMRRTPPW